MVVLNRMTLRDLDWESIRTGQGIERERKREERDGEGLHANKTSRLSRVVNCFKLENLQCLKMYSSFGLFFSFSNKLSSSSLVFLHRKASKPVTSQIKAHKTNKLGF